MFGLNENGVFGIGLKVGWWSFDMMLFDLKGNVRVIFYEKFVYLIVSNLFIFVKCVFNVFIKNLDID